MITKNSEEKDLFLSLLGSTSSLKLPKVKVQSQVFINYFYAKILNMENQELKQKKIIDRLR